MTEIRTAPAAVSAGPPRALVAAMILVPALGTAVAMTLAVRWGGVLPLTAILLGILYLASAAGVEVGFHRYFSHRAFKCRPATRWALGACGSLAGQGPVLFWAAIHRSHHRYSDTEQDPHTPHHRGLRGIWRAHIGWLFTALPTDLGRVVPDLVRDPTTVSIQRSYLMIFAGGLVAPAIVGGLFGGPRGAIEGFLWGGLARVFLNHHVTWSVNSICHLFGRRPNPTRDRSGNVWLLALPTMGGAWHNNHHAFPASATNDHRWWQLDPGAWLIRAAASYGLVWDVNEFSDLPKREHRG